jgi:hypothetical protein
MEQSKANDIAACQIQNTVYKMRMVLYNNGGDVQGRLSWRIPGSANYQLIDKRFTIPMQEPRVMIWPSVLSFRSTNDTEV